MSKKNDIEIVTVKGVDMVVVYSKTRKGKPHQKGVSIRSLFLLTI